MNILSFFSFKPGQPGMSPNEIPLEEPLLTDKMDDTESSEKSEHENNMQDLEAQKFFRPDAASSAPPLAVEYRTNMKTKIVYLAGYFLLNLSLTLYNKALLGPFRFPWLLTCIHSSFAALGCSILQHRGHFTPTELNRSEQFILVAFSALFTINIAMSNVSLAMVSVPFHQIMRSTTPVFTIIIYRLMYSRTYATSTYLSLIPLITGVALTTYGDYYFTALGFWCTLSGAVLAAVKTVSTNRLMTGSLSLPALELLARMSPLAAIQSLAISALSGEIPTFKEWVDAGNFTRGAALALVGNGILAFMLNVSSFQTNKVAGALTMTVCGNVKQCLTVLFGIVLFNVRVDTVNGTGMLLALGGAAWYSSVELKRKTRATNTSPHPQPADR
ncbi:uncharacterized protein PV09_01928 [Verruconis gallopava]|uniref:Sugar phosphate transporter domain-containing protein n=1 Tax=Verruconis gallopava TaxID=253628 RepID=A0A0D2B748_9PEZI|nr:uncharacterized protein PV09_01928 [Verruconis gallopava]KIW07034.1 hypothetical protein PV09_01928 [Verruconis gallopava]